MTQTYLLAELNQIAQWLIKNSKSKTFLFYGAMGSGKTTLIKEVAKQLGVLDMTSSPTFSLVNEYHTDNDELVYHFDFYRINDEEEAYDIGIEEYFDAEAWCFIEWPEKVENLLPLDAVIVKIKINADNSRTIELT